MGQAKVQRLAVHSLMALAKEGNLDSVLRHNPSGDSLSPAERAQWQDIVYGCQRYLGTLNAQLRLLIAKPLPSREVEWLVVVALYLLQFSRHPDHAVVNEAVLASARMSGGRFKAVVNASLRRYLREKASLNTALARNDEARFNFPLWWIRYMRRTYPSCWREVLAAQMLHPPMTLRINRRFTTAAEYVVLLQQFGIEADVLDTYAVMLAQPVAVTRLPKFAQGWASVQDFGAQKAVPLLNPQPGEHILDACAAPGGKTGHLLESAACFVTALDIDAARLARVNDNLARLGLQARTVCADARLWAQEQPAGSFDAVLADVPCTASGVVKRHPESKWQRQGRDAAQLAEQNAPLLAALWQLVRPGGRMLLSTCSLFVEENQQQAERFLGTHADARLAQDLLLLPDASQDGFYYALFHKAD